MQLPPIDKQTLRKFGLLVGGVFALIALYPLLWQRPYRVWALALAAILIAPGLLFPGILRYPYIAWMTLGAVLGWINTRLILFVVYAVLMTPAGLFMRLLRRDPIKKHFSRELSSYRLVKSARNPEHFERMF